MGLVIKDNIVTVDHNSKDHLITTAAGNPKISKISTIYGDIDVFSIFTRLKNSAKHSRDRSAKKLGDNCPLIYAFKELDDLRTTISSIKSLIVEGRKIIDGSFQIPKNSVIVCTPSSHNIVRYFAKRISKKYGLEIYYDVFNKTSKESAINDINNAIKIAASYQERKDLQNLVANLDKAPTFSMKIVSVKYRHLIRPLTLNKKFKSNYAVIVDDLISTGTTFVAGKNLLTSNSCCQNVTGISLFSEL